MPITPHRTASAGSAAPPIVVMGASGCGKSTVGRALAERLGLAFADADDLHPTANTTKMSAGIPLTDDDREPWLFDVGAWLAAQPAGRVMACSALRRHYRDLLRSRAPETVFLHLAGDRAALEGRVAQRPGHFMPVALVTSQLAALEPLGADERGLTLDLRMPVDAIVDAYLTTVTGARTPQMTPPAPDLGATS